MQVGFTTVTLRQIKDLNKIVDIAAEAGADCIEWGGDVHVTNAESARLAKCLCDEKSIPVCSYGSYYRVGSGSAAEWRGVCEIAGELGAPVVRVWLGNADSEKTSAEEYSALVAELKAMCTVAAEYGLAVCPECHDNTYNNNTDAFLKIYSETACKNFGTYFQSRYCRRDYDLDRIERTARQIECVHVSFFDMFREQFPAYKPGYMSTLVDKLKEVGYNKSIIIEFTYFSMQRGFVPALKRDIARLKALIK